MNYPNTKRQTLVEDYHGVAIADPYRWLEDENSAETKAWIKEQVSLTNNYLTNLPHRKSIQKRLEEVWNYPKFGTPFKKGKYYYFYKNDGLQNHFVLYRQLGLDGEATVFLDPNTFSEDGATSLAGSAFSHDNKYFAYTVSQGGSDWREMFILEVETGRKLTDHLKDIKFSNISWYKDGFFYNRYDNVDEEKALSAENTFAKLYYHKVGTPQSADRLVYEDTTDSQKSFWAVTTKEEKHLFLCTSKSAGDGNALAFMPIKNWETSSFTTIIASFDTQNEVIKATDSTLILLTSQDAPNQRIVTVDLTNPTPENWVTIIEEKEDPVSYAKVIQEKLFVVYMKDVSSRLYGYNLAGEEEQEIELPTLGTVISLSGNEEDDFMFYGFTSFLYPNTTFTYDFSTNTSSLFRKSAIDFEVANYETKQIFYTSKDGTKVPMFVTHKKGLVLDGQNPTLLYGYGGFNIELTPNFSVVNIPFYEAGGVYVVANLRGGSEYGAAWHKAGMLANKQNVFDDFIAAAEYLIDNQYTSKEKLAIKGGSNGGLLVGAVTNQRPDLFKVAIPAVGVMDMLRFQKFTIGWAWVAEYGSSENVAQFPNLYRYSPYHNVKSGVDYPAVLVVTAERDDRVVPAHSYKYIAELQHKHTGTNPTLIRIEQKAGHGAGKTTQQFIIEYADVWAFVFQHLSIL